MATTNGYATGASANIGDVQKRNVQAYQQVDGRQVVKIEAEDIKKRKRKVASYGLLHCLG